MINENMILSVTPSVCNESKEVYQMGQIVNSHVSEFLKTISHDIEKIFPFCEDDPERFQSGISFEGIESLLETFDSSLDLFHSVIKSSMIKQKSLISPIFASMFSNYMKMTADLLSNEVFPNSAISRFVGTFSYLERIYVSFLISHGDPVSASHFQMVWCRHCAVFENIPKLIKCFDFANYSQKLDNLYQFVASMMSEDNIRQTSDLHFMLKSIKDKLNKVEENTTKQYIRNILDDLLSFRETINNIFQNTMPNSSANIDINNMKNPDNKNDINNDINKNEGNDSNDNNKNDENDNNDNNDGFKIANNENSNNVMSKMTILSLLISNLENSISILQIKEYMVRLNSVILNDQFAIEKTDFASNDSQWAACLHLIETSVFELSSLTAPSPAIARKTVTSLYKAMCQGTSYPISQKMEKFLKQIAVIIPQCDEEYENSFISTMSNIRTPDGVFEEFKNAMKQNQMTLEDSSARFSAFLKFENVVQLYESTEVAKFRDYLLSNVISSKMQEIVPLLEEHLPQVEASARTFIERSKFAQMSSDAYSILSFLYRMKESDMIPKESEIFTENFIIFIEFINIILKNEKYNLFFCQVAQYFALPPLDLIKRSFITGKEIQKIRLLISNIQRSQFFLADFVARNQSLCNTEKDVILNHIDIIEKINYNIKQLFIQLNNVKIMAQFFSVYQKFAESFNNTNNFRLSSRKLPKIPQVLAKNIPLFMRQLLDYIKSGFVEIKNPMHFYPTLFSFLKAVLASESFDHANLFHSILDSLPFIDFSRPMKKFLFSLNKIEAILLLEQKNFDVSECVKLFRGIYQTILQFFINPILDSKDFNKKTDIFLTSLVNTSPYLYAEIEGYWPDITNFILIISSLSTFQASMYALSQAFQVFSGKHQFTVKNLVLLNIIKTCLTTLRGVCKSEYVSHEFINSYVVFKLSIKPHFSTFKDPKSENFGKIVKDFMLMKKNWCKFDFAQKSMTVLSNFISVLANADKSSDNIRHLCKINDIIHSVDNYQNKFVMIYKIKKILSKVKYDSPISQCQFVGCLGSLERLVKTEVNLLHANRIFQLANFMFLQRIKDDHSLIKSLNVSKEIFTGEITEAEQPLKMQLPEIMTLNDSMMADINLLVRNSGWMHGPTRDTLIKLVNATEELGNELKSTMKDIYHKIASFDDQNNSIIEAAQEIMEKNQTFQKVIHEKQQKLIQRKREFIIKRNVLTSYYSIKNRNNESLLASNLKKRILLQKLNSQFALKNDSTFSGDLTAGNKKYVQKDDFVVRHYEPINFVASLKAGVAQNIPSDINEARKALNDALLENDRLKNNLFRSRRADDKRYASQQKRPNVIDQYFRQIALVKSSFENQTNIISDEVNLEEIGDNLISAVSEFRKDAKESRQAYQKTSRTLLQKLDDMITVYKIQKERTARYRALIRAAKLTKEDYKAAIVKLLENEIE